MLLSDSWVFPCQVCSRQALHLPWERAVSRWRAGQASTCCMHLSCHSESSPVSAQDVVSCHPGGMNAPISWSREIQAEGQDRAAWAAGTYGSRISATHKIIWLGLSPFGAETPKTEVLKALVQLEALPAAILPWRAPVPLHRGWGQPAWGTSGGSVWVILSRLCQSCPPSLSPSLSPKH